MKKSIVFLFLILFLPTKTHASILLPTDDLKTLRAQLEAKTPMQMDEILWLARCIYSESNLENEQEHIAWVVRNRVETNYRGSNYREVILEPLQFSIFNTNTARRNYIVGLNQNTNSSHWLKALNIALKVYDADPKDRPFSTSTRHFYSPISMKNNKTPDWAIKVDPLDSQKFAIDPERFLFFEEIDESADPFIALKTPKDHIDSFNTETRERLEPVQATKTALRDRWKPSGRVARPARPNTRSSARSSTKTKRAGW